MTTVINTIGFCTTYMCSTIFRCTQYCVNSTMHMFNKCMDRCFARTKDLFHNQLEKKVIYVTWGSIVYPFPWHETYDDFITDLCATFPVLKREYIDYIIVRDNNFEQIHVGRQSQYKALVPLIDVNSEKNIYTSHIFVSYVVLRRTARSYVSKL